MKISRLKRNHAYIAFTVISSVLYLTWGYLAPTYFISGGAYDGITLRLVGVIIPILGLTDYWIRGDKANARLICELTFFGLLLNYSYILHHNHYHQIYVIGSFIIQTGANSIIDREKPLILYNILNLLLAPLIFFDPAPQVNSYFYLTSVATIAVIMGTVNLLRLGAQRSILALEERLVLEENKRIIFEGLAHEINNPLMILQSFKERIQKIAARSTDQEMSEILDVIIKDKSDSLSSAITRIKTVISDVHKTACGNLVIHKEEINVGEILKEILIPYHTGENKKHFEIIEETALIIHYDRSSIQRILHELIQNARDFADSKAWIRISTNKVVIGNDGPAIPKHLESKIFEPFFTTKDIGAGKGLGLSIAKGLCMQHASSIYLNDNVEKKVSFEILF